MKADIEKIISEMTLADKIALCSGEDYWHTKAMPQYRIPPIMMTDGPHGLRKQDSSADIADVNQSVPATCFPTACLSGASWDESILERIGAAIAEEALAENVAVVLGPGINIKRNPLCGRNFEYFSEDPYLSGKLGAAFLKGMRFVGIGGCVKHFACNSQELDRMQSNSFISERALREIYLSAFETAVKEGKPSMVMCAYNMLNGTYCSDSKQLLTEILRDEWGFDGVVVTDWGAMNNRVSAFKAGCDLNMPGGSAFMEKTARRAVKKGTLDEEDINRSVRRILELVMKQNDIPAVPGQLSDHNDFAAHVACESAVLLKNSDNILPLKKDQKVVLIGAMAKNMRYQGSGSSHINPPMITNPTDAMPDIEWVQGCNDNGETDEGLISDAQAAAAEADVAVVFAGLPSSYESEGFDRADMKMPSGHLRIIGAVSDANPNTVVVLMCGSPVECPWADHVKGILYMGLPGQAGGIAVKRLLFGDANPSGRLTESWPFEYSDCISSEFYGTQRDALYAEDIYVGYRYYDKANVPVRWPFGYGLSYTTFEYSDLKIEDEKVHVTVTNTEKEAGGEVVMMFISQCEPIIHRPLKELKGFKKLYLEPGESEEVIFSLDNRSFAIWQNGWVVPSGLYDICVGPLQESINVSGDEIKAPDWQLTSWYETLSGSPTLADLETAAQANYKMHTPKRGEYNMNCSISEMKESSFVMKVLHKAVIKYAGKHNKADPEDPAYKMMLNSSVNAPLRSLQILSGTRDGIFRGLLKMANGHFFGGLMRMIKKQHP